MNREEFKNEIQKMGIVIDDKVLNQLEIYADFLITCNKTTNLTAIVDHESIFLKHFYDSLAISQVIDLNCIKNVVDVGTGAGFPGMVLKIVYPHLNMTLIDSNNKKTKFLELLCEKLKINDVEIINCRSEDYARQHLDEFDLVTARAVTNLSILTELTLPIVKVGGYFIPLKGDVTQELKQSQAIIAKLNGQVLINKEYHLPFENSYRTLLKIQKMAPTPKGYPRNFSVIKKALKNKQK